MTKKLKKFLVCIISVFCVVALGVAIGCADSTPSEKEILTDAEERVIESDNLPINDPSCCEEDHMVQTLAASKVTESHSSHTTQITSSTTTISSGNYYLNANVKLNSYINVTGSVHICLNGHTLTGGSNSVIVVNGGTLYLHDCQGSGKITGGIGSNIIWTTGGSSQSMGGGITVANGGTLHMYGGTITGNQAGAMGGGVIIAYNSNMIMYGGTISDNTGGWLGNGGVGVLGYFLMTGGTISGNSEPSSANGFGGGVSVSTEGSYAGTFEMTGGTISGNSSKQGAGVYAYTGTSLKITGGTISGNTASAEGGGIYALVNASISGATITGNKTTISSSSYGGGGISVPYGTATISNCTITDNSASNGCGGGICVNSGCTATLSGCTITGNSASKYGGGIYFSGTLKISGKMIVHSNTVSKTANDIYLSSNQYVTLGGNLSSGSDVGVYFASSSQTQATASESSTSYYKNSYSYFFPENKSGNYVATYSSYVYFTTSNAYFCAEFKLSSSVSSTRYYTDLSDAVGTASSAYDSATTVTVKKAVSVSSAVTIASGTSVTFDTAGYKITGPSSSYLFNVKGTLSIKGNGTITGCSSSNGAIYVPSGGSLSIQDVTISGNYSSGCGGGVYIASSSASFTMSSGYIQNNTAKTGGAGIYLASKATATFTGGTVYNNTVSGSANNIYLSSGATIKFSSKNNLTNTKVGVTAAGTGSSSVQITNAVNSSMTTDDIDGHVIADSCKCVCVKSGVVYFADDHNYKITGFTYVDDASGCTATATNTCGYCDATTTTAGMAVTYGFDSDGNAYRYVEGYEEYREEFSEGFLVESASGVYTLYDTLEDALENADDGSTVHLLEDIAEGGASEAISVSGNVTIDLNGHTVDYGISTGDGATVTITDGIGGGKVTGTLSEENGGGFVLHGGTYTGCDMDFVLDRTDWTDKVVAVDGGSYTVAAAEDVGESYGILVEYATENEGRSVYFASADEAGSFVNGKNLSADITLVGDVVGDLTLTTTGETTISLGGHTLTGNLSVSGGDTDISLGGGTLEGSLEVSAENSSVDLEGGTVTGGITLGGQSLEMNFGGGTAGSLTITSGEAFVDLDGGSVTGTVTLGGSEADLYFGEGGEIGGLAITCGENAVHMEGGTVSGSISVSGEETKADIDFDGGNVTGGVSVTGGSVAIDLGDSEGTITQGVSVSGGEAVLDLYGGTVSGGISVSGGGKLTVVDTSSEGGGTVEGNVTSDGISTLTVRAGTYSAGSGVIPHVDWSAYVLVYDEGSATYTVTDNPGKDFLATVAYGLDDGSTVTIYCDTLLNAVSVAKSVAGNGQTVTLLGDAGTNAENISVAIGTDVTLDLNGYTVYGSITATENATVTIVDTGTDGPDKGYGDGTVTGYVGESSGTLHVTAGTYYCDSVLNHLGDGTGEAYVAAVDDIEIEGEISPVRVYIVMTEKTAMEIAADVCVSSSYSVNENGEYVAEGKKTYYIRLDVALADISGTEKGGMIFVYKDSVSETKITLEGEGFVLVIDLNGKKIEVNLLIKADSSEYVKDTCDAESGRQAGDGANLIVTSSCNTTTPSISGVITVDGESEDYEIWGPYDSENVPYPTGIAMTDAKISETQTGTTVLTAGQELELYAAVTMYKDRKAYDGEVTWSISGDSGVVSFSESSSVEVDGSLKTKAENSVASVKIKAESPGCVKVIASVKGKTESGSCETYTAEADIVVKTDYVTGVTIKQSDEKESEGGTAEESLVLTLSEGGDGDGDTASLEAVIQTAYGTEYSAKDIEWKSLNDAVATVTAKGSGSVKAAVQGVTAGVTLITVIVDGVESEYVTVIVKTATVVESYDDDQLEKVNDTAVILPRLADGYELWFTEDGPTFDNNDNLELYKDTGNTYGGNSYVIVGTASQMTAEQAKAFNGGNEDGEAKEGDPYVIIGISVGAGESIYSGSEASGTVLWTNGESDSEYYIVLIALKFFGYGVYTVTNGESDPVTYVITFGEMTNPAEVTVSSVTVIPSGTSVGINDTVTFTVVVTYSDNTVLLMENLTEGDLTYCLGGVTWTVCCCDCEGTCGCACCGGAGDCECGCDCDGDCGCVVENTDGGYTFTPTAEGVYRISVSVKEDGDTVTVTSNVVTITVATSETGKTYSISVAEYDDSVTGSALTSGESYTISLTEDEEECMGSVTWISSDSTVAAVSVDANGTATLYAKMAGTATIYAVVDGVKVAETSVTIFAVATEDEVETKEFFNSYENTLLFVNGVTYSTDLKVVLNLTSVLEGDDMGYNFMLSDGDEEDGTAVYSIVAGHIHHYRYAVWSMSDDGVITLRFVCGCNAGETDKDGEWVTYEVNVNDVSASDWGWNVIKSVEESEGAVTVTYTASVTLSASAFTDKSYGEVPEYAQDTAYQQTFTLNPVVMAEFYDDTGNVVATLYFEDGAKVSATVRDVLSENATYAGAAVTLLSDIKADLEISSGDITVNLNGFCLDGNVTVSNDAVVAIENVTDAESSTVLVHGTGGKVTGEVEADGSGEISITGGSYSHKEVADYVAAGYIVVYDENTGYTVKSQDEIVESNCEAKIDVGTGEDAYTIYYTTLEAALRDAEDGDTVTLLTDVTSTPEKTYIVGSDITLNLDGHTLTGSIETSSGTGVEINLGGGEVTGGITAYGDLELSLGKNGSTETFGSVGGGVTVYGDAEISLDGGTIKGGVTLYGDSEVSFGGGEIEDGLTLSGGNAGIDLEGGTVTGGISVTSGADAKIDLDGGKIYGDISVSGGSALSISDSSTAGEDLSYGNGLVIGDISTDNGRSSVEISGGTYSYDVTDLVSDGLVVFVGSYTCTEDCKETEIRVYTVMSEEDAQSLSEASRTYENGAGDTVTVYYDGIGDALGDLLSGDVLTIWATITPEGEDGLVISGREGSAVKNVTVDLNGNTIEGDLTVSEGSSVVLDLNGGTVAGDITAEAGSSLYVTDSSEEEGIVTGKVSGDAAAVEIDAGTYGNNVLGYITDGKVIYVNAVKEGDESNTYTVTTAEEISESGKHVGATVTYEKDGETVTVYFESSVDAVEYAKEISTGGVTAYVTLYETIDYTETDLGGIETVEGNDIVVNLNGHGITGDITIVSGSSLTIEDTDPQTYDGDVTGVELVDGEISVTGGTLSVTGGIYTDDISGYLSEDDFALVSSYEKEDGGTGKIYEIVGEDLAKDLSVVSISTDGEKPVYFADADAAVSGAEEKLNENAEAKLTIVVVADGVTGADFSLPSGDVTIDFNGNTLEGDITLGTNDGETKVTLTFTDSGTGDDGMTGGGLTGTVTVIGENTDSEVILKAGTYNKDAFDDYEGGLTFADICDGDGNVVDRYVPVYGDETFTVIPESAAGDHSVAGVDLGDGFTVYFTDIDDALGYAAENGGTVTLYADAESSAEISVTADVTIDLNGHSLVAADVVIYADDGGTLTITDEGEDGRFKGLVTAEVSDEDYSEEENPYEDAIVLEIKPMEGDLVVTVVTDAKNAGESVSECYVFSETEDGFGIVNIADHTHRCDVPVWEYEASGEFEGMIRLTFKCACGKFDDFVGYYQLTATENGDGTVTLTAEAEIFSEVHKGTYVYDETKKFAARVNVDGRTIYYEDIKEALEAAEESGATLVLMGDFSGELSVSSDITVDLNGHDVSGLISVDGGATLDIEGEGRVDAVISVGNDAEILVGGGTYDDGNFDDVYENLADGCAVVIGRDSNGNTIYTVCDVTAAEENSEAAITDENGVTTYYESIEDAVNALKEGDTLVLWDDVESGLTIDADKTGNIEIDLNGKEILGGINIESSDETEGVTVTVTDSTSEGGKGDGKVVGGITAGEGVTLVIEGGTYGAGFDSAGAEGEESSDGGNAYDEDIIRDFAAEDKVIFNNADGSISVVDGDVAEALAGAAVTWTDDDCVVHREYYETLQDAVEDAEGLEGAVVTLYGDNPSDITVSGDVTIDLNGHTEDGDVTVNAGATLTLTDSSDDNSGTVDGKIVTEDHSSVEEKTSGKVILSGGTYDFGSFDEGALENVSLGEYTDENGETKIFVAVFGDLETSVDGDGNETVSGTFTVMTEGEAQESGAVKVTVTTAGGDDTTDVYFKDIESALEYATETGGKITLYEDAEAEKVIEITGSVEIDLNGHALDANIMIDAVTNPEASLTVAGVGEISGTVTVILDDSSSDNSYGETLTVDGSIDISDLDVSLKNGSADGEPAENFFFAGSADEGYGICTGEHVCVYELVSVVYDEKTCTVTIVIKCACGDVLVSETVDVSFGEYDGTHGTITGTAGIETDADGDGINETYDFDIALTPAAEVVTEDGDTYYFESLDDAISFAAEKDAEGVSAEIILLTDVENITLTGDENVVIDLGGHTVTGTVSVDEDASLTIKGTGEIDAGMDIRGDLTIDGGSYVESEEKYEGHITVRPDGDMAVAEGGTLTIEGVVEIILDGTDLDIGSTYVEAEDGDAAQFEFSYGVVIGGDLTITVTGDSTLSAEGGLTITDDGSLTINIREGTLTLDTDGNSVTATVTVEGGANLLAEDTSGTNEGRLDGTVYVEEGGYVAFEDKTFADEGNGLEIVFEGNTETEKDKYIMESAADEYGETYQRSTSMEEHRSHGHAFDVIAVDEDGGYVYEFDPSMSLITLHFTCLCGEELTCFVYLTEDDYYAFVTETGEVDEKEEIVEIVYSLTAVVVSTNGTSAEYGLYGTAYIPMFQRADDVTRSDPESYVYSEDNPYYYGAEDASCTEGGEDVYIYGTQNGVIIRESVGIIHHGLEEVGVASDGRKIYHCTECDRYFMEGYTDIAGDAAYGDLSEIEKELEREEIFNETKDELLSELESRLTGCTGDFGAAKEAYDKAVSEIDGWEYEFGGGEAEDRDDYLDTLLAEIERAAAEAEFAIAEETQKTISENELKELFKDILDEDGNVTEKYEEYYSETARQQIRELYDTALQDLGNFGFSADDVEVTDSDSRYLEYTEWLEEMYGAYVQRIADELKSVDVIKVDTHEELSDEETMFSYVSNEAGMSGAIKLIITKVDGGKLDKAIGKAEIVSGDTDENKMSEEEMEAALEGKSVIGVYDFKLWDTLSDVQVITFNGLYYVCLQLPEELQGRNDLQIVYLGDDGILEVYRTYTDLDAGCLYFTTTHFSQYIIMGVEEKDLMPPIIVLSVFGGMELIALVILIAVFVVRKKKGNVVEENAPAKKKLAGLGLLPLLAVIIPTGAVGIIIGLAAVNALLIAGIIVFIYLILTKTGKGVVEYELGSSSDGNAPSGAGTSLQDGLASNCSAIDEAKRYNS